MVRASIAFALVALLSGAGCSSPPARSNDTASMVNAHFDRAQRALARDRSAATGKRDDRFALAELSEAIRLAPDFTEAYRARGYLHYHNGRSTRAIEDYTRAIQLEPNDARTYYLRGWAHAYRRQLERAIADYDRTIQLQPEHAGAYYNRGLAYRSLGRASRAEADMERARELGFQD